MFARLLRPRSDVPRPAAPRPRIVLHIGRNKAGSTTIQDACLAAKDALAAQGVAYALFGHLAGSRTNVPGFATFPELAAHATAHPSQAHLVSNEFMFGWPDAYTLDAARSLAGCDVRVLAYVRPYDAWVVSAYAEETRRGMNRRDIDTYLADMAARVSAWPHLKVWGEAFGWDRLRVRSLDPASLHGGDLLADFAHALRVAPLAAPRSNAAPHWTELELVRALALRDGDADWAGVAREEAEPLVALLRGLGDPGPAAPYLTGAQRTDLRALYDADLGRIEAAGGGPLPRAGAPPSGPERAFVPAWTHAPYPLRYALKVAASEPAFVAVHLAAAFRVGELAP